MMTEIDILKRQLEREKKARRILESEIEKKTRNLYTAYEENLKIFNSLGVGVIVTNLNGKVLKLNELVSKKIDISENDNIYELIEFEKAEEFELDIDERTYSIVTTDGEKNKIFTFTDITKQKNKDEKIKSMQEDLIEAAYKDGVAENAKIVLHNIGNILTMIVNYSSYRYLKEEFQEVNEILKKCHTGLGENKNPEKISYLLEEISKKNEELFDFIFENFTKIKEKSFCISEIISAQQKLSQYKMRKEDFFDIDELVSDCFKIHKGKILKNKISVEINLKKEQKAYFERIGVSQVISNIILNSIESIQEKKKLNPEFLDQKILVNSAETSSYYEVIFEDNGVGIGKDKIEKVFDYGFSTKEESSGFGLHNCANIIRSLGGEISIKSKGENLGAVVSLRLKKEKGLSVNERPICNN